MEAADPTRLVRQHIEPLASGWMADAAGPVLVVGAGKAAARMAAGCEAVLGAQQMRGMVITAQGCAADLDSVATAVASHPIPDHRSVDAATALWRLLADAPPGPAIALISGGASSLLVMPRAPIGLEEKIEVNRLLLACGADIVEINTVRKHLSAVKGGGLLRAAAGRRLHTIIISDVVGDDPSIVGSGPTVPDQTTFAEAQTVLHRYRIASRVAPSVRALLQRGVEGREPETVRPSDGDAAASESAVVGSNRTARLAAAAEARRLGYDVAIADQPLTGDSAAAARHWLGSVGRGARRCTIAGGETTVEVRGPGRGGRNQEFALALVEPIAGTDLLILSAGTDGVDGPTDAAGAFVDGGTLTRARQRGLEPGQALDRNDSYTFFDCLGDLLRTGPTGTNVMDLKLAIHT